MRLEAQLETLASLGLSLAEGVTVDDLLLSWPREEYESRPFDLVVIALGIEVEREPWGRPMCVRAWNFDAECIEGSGDYSRIVRRLCAMTGDADYLTDVRDQLDLARGTGVLEYNVGGQRSWFRSKSRRRWTIEVNDDWADLLTLAYVMDELERDGCHFHAKDNGQARVLLYLEAHAADRLNALTGGAVQRVVPE